MPFLRISRFFSDPPAWLHAVLIRIWRGLPADVETEYLRSLFGSFIHHGPVCILAGVYLYLAAPSLPPDSTLSQWLVWFVMYHLVRTVLGVLFTRRIRPELHELYWWCLISLLLHAAGGLLLLYLALLLYPLLDFMAQNVLLMVVLVIVGTSAFSLAGRWLEMFAYAPPIYLGFAWSTWGLAHDYARPVAILVLLFFGLYLFQARNQHRSMLQSFALARHNGELATELQFKNIELQEVASARSRLLATVSHDLRQPSHAIGLLCERAMLESNPAYLKEALRDLNELSQSLSASLTTLMDLTRLDAALVKANIGPVALNQVLLRLEAEFSGSARNKGLTLEVPQADLWIRSDPVLLHGVLANLVSNAIKYTRSGGVQVLLERHGDELILSVQDSGMGIKPDKLGLIFKEFVRLEGAESGTEGLGLGLSIVRRYAILLKHSLSVRSEPGQGSCFSIKVPVILTEVSPEETLALSHSADRRLAGLRVVVVDNVDLVLSSMVRTLSAWGCQVHAAGSLSEAMDVARQHPLDLIISDFHLGDEEPDGLMLINTLRTLVDPIRTQVPALLMTGDVSGQLESEAGRCEVGILHKPVRPAVLQNRLIDLLQRPLPPRTQGPVHDSTSAASFSN